MKNNGQKYLTLAAESKEPAVTWSPGKEEFVTHTWAWLLPLVGGT